MNPCNTQAHPDTLAPETIKPQTLNPPPPPIQEAPARLSADAYCDPLVCVTRGPGGGPPGRAYRGLGLGVWVSGFWV